MQGADGAIIGCNASGDKIPEVVARELQSPTSMTLHGITIGEDRSPFPGEGHPGIVAVRTGKRVSKVCVGIRKLDDTTIRILFNAKTMFREGESQRCAVVTVCDDITDRKCAQQKVLEKRQELNNTLDVVTPYIVLLSSGNRLVGHRMQVESFEQFVPRHGLLLNSFNRRATPGAYVT